MSSVNIGNIKSNKPLSSVLVVVERIMSSLSSTTGSPTSGSTTAGPSTGGVSTTSGSFGVHPTSIENTNKNDTNTTNVFSFTLSF